jgi:putative sigma-54 modulation protein
MVLLDVIAAARRVHLAVHGTLRERRGHRVQELAPGLPHVEHRDAAEGPAVGRLATALRVERGPVEDHGRGAAEGADGEDPSVEREQGGIVEVKAFRHGESVAVLPAHDRERCHHGGMKLAIHVHHLAMPKDLPQFLQKHVTRPLARIHDDPAALLTVHLGDSVPKKRGVDQECRMSFRMPGARTMHVESVADDLYKALLDATDRMKRLVKRNLEKMRSPSRKTMHRPLGRAWRERSTRRGVTPSGEPSAL